MAMNGTQLASELKAVVDAIIANEGPKTNDELLTAFANTIVTHIQTNAEVIVAGGSSAGTYNVQ